MYTQEEATQLAKEVKELKAALATSNALAEEAMAVAVEAVGDAVKLLFSNNRCKAHAKCSEILSKLTARRAELQLLLQVGGEHDRQGQVELCLHDKRVAYTASCGFHTRRGVGSQNCVQVVRPGAQAEDRWGHAPGLRNALIELYMYIGLQACHV